MAFQHVRLDQELYVCQPEKFEVAGKVHHVHRLLKALYELKQAFRLEHQMFPNFLKVMGFDSTLADPQLYVAT